MNTLRTRGIILKRMNYGEADRVLTLLTYDHGKIVAIAKGVRKQKSKLAGGIELFCESDISFMRGKGEMATLVSTKLLRHFSHLLTDYERMQLVAKFLKRLDTVTEQHEGSEFYELAVEMMLAMNTKTIPPELTAAWATLRLMILLGEVPSLESDASGAQFSEDTNYRYSYETSQFSVEPDGPIAPSLIKFLRFLGVESPAKAVQVKNAESLGKSAYQLLDTSYSYARPSSL